MRTNVVAILMYSFIFSSSLSFFLLSIDGMSSLNRSRWHQSNDLTDQKMALDRRVLDYIVGLDSEINELVEGSDLYG